MPWYEITALAAPAEADAVAATMREVAPGGVSVDEPVDILGPEMGFQVRPGEPVAIRAYVPASELGAVLTEQLRTTMHERFPGIELVAKPLHEQDWAVAWRDFFGVVDFGGRTVIVPSWVEHEPHAGQLVIRLDPGQAFGTGHHETTRLCLAALEDAISGGEDVLDVGTGSGVLAIAAVLLGAARVTALDFDPVAVEVAGCNAVANGVADQIAFRHGTLEQGATDEYDLVVANISTGANIALAPAFGTAVRPGGSLVLSGILAADATRVAEALHACGFSLTARRVERDWALLEFLRPTLDRR